MDPALPRLSWRLMSPLQIVKYAIFALVILNFCSYVAYDIGVAKFLPADASLIDRLQAFGDTIDYVAWMVLIAVYELETGLISREKLDGRLSKLFTGIASACYVVLLFACWSYFQDLAFYTGFGSVSPEAACSSLGSGYNVLNSVGEYAALTADNCAAVAVGGVLVHAEDPTFVTAAALVSGKKLAVVAVINAVAWLVLVVVFQLEFLLERRIGSTNRWSTPLAAGKALLYLVLLADAVYWAAYGNLLDAWDAFLWLIAFVAIDLNGFGLSEEPVGVPVRSS